MVGPHKYSLMKNTGKTKLTREVEVPLFTPQRPSAERRYHLMFD